ncbi:MAG: hypothetical protein ACRBK7_14065 [Acidimicrobiales bacterium]
MGQRFTDEVPEVNARFDADGLYKIVEAYAGFGDHHTGSEADRQTTDWLASVLQNLGTGGPLAATEAGFAVEAGFEIEVDLPSYEFERYICRATLLADGQPVPMVPVFYSGRGSYRTDRLEVVELDRSIVGPAESLDELIERSDLTGATDDQAHDGRALVVALNGPEDLPVQANRIPWEAGQSAANQPAPVAAGRPAVIIPGNWADRVRAGAQLDFEAATETTTSRNVVAELGSPDNPGVIITTPLTGWTRCAGERGTGLATALAMAANLASDYRVQFIACSGHELDHIGMQHHLSKNDVSGRPVIHLGASVGAVDRMPDGSTPLGAGRATLTTAAEPIRSQIAQVASRANWRLIDPPDWPGEGAGWRAAGASVLSFLGGFEHFHVASDLPEVATTPESLELATATAIEAARLFLDRMAATGPGDATQ